MDGIESLVLSVAVASVRPLAAFSVLPFAGEGSMKAIFAMPSALAVAALVAPTLGPLPSGGAVGLLVAKEALLGASIGFGLSRVFLAVLMAGALIDQHAGYTFGNTLNPGLGIATGPVENLFAAVYTLLLFGDDAARELFTGIAGTYGWWPVTSLLPEPWAGVDATVLAGHVQQLAELVIRLAGPAIGLLLAADVCVAIAARYAQQLNVFSISLALKALVASLMLGYLLRAQLVELARLAHASWEWL
jgi:type III secretory pathway component EscT